MFDVRHPIHRQRQCRLQVEVTTPPDLPRRHIETWAIIDTGSPETLIRKDLVGALGLPPVGVEVLTHPTVTGEVPCGTVSAVVLFRGNDRRVWRWEPILVVAPGTMEPGLILGMNALEGGVFTIDFPAGIWSFRVAV